MRKFTKYPSSYKKVSAYHQLEVPYKKLVVYENDKIRVESTGRDYDFIGTIENLTDSEYCFADDYELSKKFEKYLGYVPDYCIAPHDWVGILADDEGYTLLNFFDEL